jgi:hypothetical protein
MPYAFWPNKALEINCLPAASRKRRENFTINLEVGAHRRQAVTQLERSSKKMKLITAALFLFLCGNPGYSQDTPDPFAGPDPQSSPSVVVEDNITREILAKFTCIGSGTLTGKALDARVKSIVISISEFYDARKRVPKGIEELVAFCEKQGVKLHDLRRLSPVEFVDDKFIYSAGYDEGTLHLAHISGYYITFAMLEPTKAAHGAGGKRD